jgi:RNA polymerase sigma factor (sigma-70 family)
MQEEEYEGFVKIAADPNRHITHRHEAFGHLVHLFQDMAYSIAYGTLEDFHTAQDAVQEAFVTAYRKLDQLQEPKAFPGWFKQIVISQCYRLVRNKRVVTRPIETTADLIATDPDPALAVEDFELKNNVLKAIQSLPEREQLVTKLFYFNGYSQNEIAKLLQIPVTTVKKRLQYARQHIKGALLSMFEVVTPSPAPTPIPIPVPKQLPPHLHRK